MAQNLRDWIENYECSNGCEADKELITRKVEEKVLEFEKYMVDRAENGEFGQYNIRRKFKEIFGDFEK